MGRIIRLVIVALVLLAAWRSGQVFMAHYRFSDEVDTIAERGVRTDDAAVRGAVNEAAGRFGIPVKIDDVAIRLQGEHVYIDLTYVQSIEILPRYRLPWTFEVHAHGWEVPSGGMKK
jgi:hypothetical protein